MNNRNAYRLRVRSYILVYLFLFLSFKVNAQTTNTYKSPVVDTFWGTAINDPYRWLESLDSDSTKAWLKYQQKITQSVKKQFNGAFNDIYDKLVRDGRAYFDNYIKEGPYYFEYVQPFDGAPVLYYKTPKEDDFSVAYNPNREFVKKQESISDFSLSNDARYIAVSLSNEGTDWMTIIVHNLKKQKDLPDKIEWVKYSNICWTDSGFFYSRYKKPEDGSIHIASNSFQQLCFHKLGEDQQDDKIIYTIPDEANATFGFDLIDHDRYLILYSIAKINGVWNKIVAYKDLHEGMYSKVHMFLASPRVKNIQYDVLDYVHNKFIVQTDLGASCGRVVLCNKDSLNSMEIFIPEYKEVLIDFYSIDNQFLGLYFGKGTYSFYFFDTLGDIIHGLKFPPGISIADVNANPSDSIITYRQSSFNIPAIISKINIHTYHYEPVSNTEVYYDAEKYVTEIVTYKSRDGTEIPMYLAHKKGLKPSKLNPLILYGYGGFGLLLDPLYKYSNIVFFENNGILAFPMIRGGGEFGNTWHDLGKGLNKQNSFDDFISAAQYLIDSGYTSKDRLAIRGGSNGGLLVGAVITQHPELFKVAIGEMGVYDMLRYHLFTGGRFIEEEYGSVNDSIQFVNLLRYSPLQNIKDGMNYPATLLVTAENDERVPPFHTYKFLAALQAISTNDLPHILYFEENAGHQGSPTWDEREEEEAFVLAFIFNQMGIKVNTQF